MPKAEIKKGEVYILNRGLLGGWLCIEKDMPEDEALELLWDKLRSSNTIISGIPTDDIELFRDRLFGGFKCGPEENRSHVYFAIGHYTFLSDEQRPLTPETRKEIWLELLDPENGNVFLGEGPFTSDHPKN